MTKEEFLSIADGYYAEFESLKDSPNFYDYEKSLVEMMEKLGREYMEKKLCEGSVTKNRQKKNLNNPLRRNIHIEVSQLYARTQKWFWH
jgi:hypothetical protein